MHCLLQNSLRVAGWRMAQQAEATTPEYWSYISEPKWWTERSDPHKLFSDFHIACCGTQHNTHAHSHTQLKRDSFRDSLKDKSNQQQGQISQVS